MKAVVVSRLQGGVALSLFYLLLATPVGRNALEASMSAHLLIQMLLLVAIGAGGRAPA